MISSGKGQSGHRGERSLTLLREPGKGRARIPIPAQFLHLLQTGASFPLSNAKIFPRAIEFSINYPVFMARLSLTPRGGSSGSSMRP